LCAGLLFIPQLAVPFSTKVIAALGLARLVRNNEAPDAKDGLSAPNIVVNLTDNALSITKF